MKNLGTWTTALCLALLAGLWTLAPAPRPGAGRSQKSSGDALQDHPERGDVPGWVMITLMSAVLVAALLALAGPALETMFNQAMDKVGS